MEKFYPCHKIDMISMPGAETKNLTEVASDLYQKSFKKFCGKSSLSKKICPRVVLC